ncbi:MAG: D-alanyl-D-alanine carboxypeptidase family protein [Ahniella sp.]|nr:D-alanyl-D-alanine carboxypeptidase family protein [Ahniella sp.]
MPAPLRFIPSPALLNSAGLVLRPVCTARDLAAVADWASTLESTTRRNTLAACYLIEDKFAVRTLGLLACHRRAPREAEATVELVLAENTSPEDESAFTETLAQLLAVSRHDPVAGKAISEKLATSGAGRAAHWCEQFGVPSNHVADHQLPLILEPMRLFNAGRDYVGRSLWLEHATRQDWLAMQAAAAASSVMLDAVSGFRSIEYQAGIWRRKRDRGMTTADILAINVPPGYSEHHSGRALDITTPGCGAAEPEFAGTAAFEWLTRNAHRFGFVMSFPENNIHGVMYEPWHWCHQG